MSGEYRTILNKLKTHLASGMSEDSFFINSSQNIRDMRTTYSSLNTTKSFMEWLEVMAYNEDNNHIFGSIEFGIMGG